MRVWAAVVVAVIGCAPQPRSQPAAQLIDPRPLPAPVVSTALPEWLEPPPCEAIELDALDRALLGGQAMHEPWARRIVDRPLELWDALLDRAIARESERRDSSAALLLRAYSAYRAERYDDAWRALDRVSAPEAAAVADYLSGLVADAQGSPRLATLRLERARRTARHRDVELAARYRLARREGGRALAALAYLLVGGRFEGAIPDQRGLACRVIEEVLAEDDAARFLSLTHLYDSDLSERVAAHKLAGNRPIEAIGGYRVLIEASSDAERACIWLAGSLVAIGRHEAGTWTLELLEGFLGYRKVLQVPRCHALVSRGLGEAARTLHARNHAPRWRDTWRGIAELYQRHIDLTDDPDARLDSLHHQSRLLARLAIETGAGAAAWREVARKADQVARATGDAEARRLATLAEHNARLN